MGPASKLCVICGSDCAGKPRVKDAKGRYYCKACHERAMAVQQPQEGPLPLMGGAMLDELLGPAVELSNEPCPGCGQDLADNAMLCVNCGYNRHTGQALQTQAIAGSTTRRSSRTAWPIVIGVICLCWGGFQVLSRGADLVLMAGAEVGGGVLVGNALGIIIALYLLVGAVQLLGRKPSGPATLKTWSRIALVFSLLGLTCVGIAWAALSGSDMQQMMSEVGAESDFEAAAMLIIGAIFMVIQIVWAIFLLIWFGRSDIESEVASW